MKDSISIIFAVMILSFLIVILPLFSILDRQDSMSYNVVLNLTTNFVDEIRSNGFLTQKAYINYIKSLRSTGNSYKVTLQTYKKTLIPSVDENGNTIANSYEEVRELHNSLDISDYLGGVIQNEEAERSNIMNNIYLFDANDEIYVRVYNTNTMLSSIMYNMIIGAVDTNIIDITYGGMVNSINWELYTELKRETIATPEINLSVPVNELNQLNINKILEDSKIENVTCELSELDNLFSDVYDLCNDLTVEDTYAYIYDLDKEENTTIKFAVEFSDVSEIVVGTTEIDDKVEYITLNANEIKGSSYFDGGLENQSEYEKYIINNYIKLKGMIANIDLVARPVNSEYAFDIILYDVEMSNLSNISILASINILPGLGRNIYRDYTVGTESIKIQLTSRNKVKTAEILGPYNWKEFLKVGSATDALINNEQVFVNQELFYKIQYTGIQNTSPIEVANIVKEKIKYACTNSATCTDYIIAEYITPEQLITDYNAMVELDTIVVKFAYPESALGKGKHYLVLPNEWYLGITAAESKKVDLYKDEYGPNKPTIVFDGQLGENGWYTSNVEVYVYEGLDRLNERTVGGSGIYNNLIEVIKEETNEVVIAEKDADTETIITNDGIYKLYARSQDYIGYYSPKEEVTLKIDKVIPTQPQITLEGNQGEDEWYMSDVIVNIIPGTDELSGVSHTTYQLQGPKRISETEGTTFTIDESGRYTIVATTYDNAGNKSITILPVKVDKGTPPKVTFEVINGIKKEYNTGIGTTTVSDWYSSDVKIRINVELAGVVTQSETSSYRIEGTNPQETTTFLGDTKDVIVTENGIYKLVVTTTTIAGVTEETSMEFKIDKDAPQMPTITKEGTKGMFGWYTSDVKIKVDLNGDIGDSGENKFYFKSVFNEEIYERYNIPSGTELLFEVEGEQEITIITTDKAGNEQKYQETIKIDKTLPHDTGFKIEAKEGAGDNPATPEFDGWYISTVRLSYNTAKDDVSGINTVKLSDNSIYENTAGKEVTLTIKDNAGNIRETKRTIKVDNTNPTVPTITLPNNSIDIGAAGITAYNQDVNITIVPGVEIASATESGYEKTTFQVKKSGTVYINETEGTEINITESGIYTIIAKSYDNAGNYSVSSTIIIIEKEPPEPLKILSINSINGANVVGTKNTIDIVLENWVGGEVTLTLVGPETQTVTTNGSVISATVSTPGEYVLVLTQKSIYNLTSLETVGSYTYSID